MYKSSSSEPGLGAFATESLQYGLTKGCPYSWNTAELLAAIQDEDLARDTEEFLQAARTMRDSPVIEGK